MLINTKIKNKLKILFVVSFIIIITSIIRFSLSAKLENGAEVEFSSELTYYLDVTYDGVDKYGIESNDTARASVTSDYIYVEDKLPEGLIFNGFVTTRDNTFGAVTRDGLNNVCPGSVLDDSIEERTTRLYIWLDYNGEIIKSEELDWSDLIYAEVLAPSEPYHPEYEFDRWDGPYFDEDLNVIYKATYQSASPQYFRYQVEWYDINGQKIKESEVRSGLFGINLSVEDSDKIVSGYVFDENNPNNILFTTLVSNNKKLKLYFIPSNQVNDNTENSINRINIVDNNSAFTYNFYGLHYNEQTRKVSFKIKNLQAGCKLTIGIKTITPSTTDDPTTEEIELRRDFYNFGSATEYESTKLSNTVHAWMGTEQASLYNVKYEYIGDIPNNAPALPLTSNYSVNSKVGVALIPLLEGYRFNGWTTTDINVLNNTFIMPEKNVTFKGSFEKLDEYKVSYEIEGIIPDGYIIPLEKTHYINKIVKLDSLQKGDIFNGYRFLGWDSNDVIINEDKTFIMPEKDVTIIGRFEPVTYKVEYRFYDTIIPPNSENLLPTTKEYQPGTKINLEYPSEIEGYKFLGWYHEDNFKMPENDVIIYGEWKLLNGTFTPSIKKEIVNEQDYYRSGDIVYYKITVTNNADYEITNIYLEEKNDKAMFYKNSLWCLEGTSNSCQQPYNIKTQRLVEINKISPHSSVEVLAKYVIDNDDQGTITNEIELISALASNNYELDTTMSYKSSASFKIQSQLKICKEINSSDSKTFQFHITDNLNYDSWINLSNNECTNIYLKPNFYNISEIIPQEFILKETLLIEENNNSKTLNNKEQIEIEFGKNYQIIFKNQYKKKGFYHSDGRIVNKVDNEHKKIIINVDDYTKEYDGLPITDISYNINGNEDNIVNVTFPKIEYKNAGTYDISPIVSFNNEDDESKYEIVINEGELNIKKRTIKIKSDSAEKMYDGTPLTANTCFILSGDFVIGDTYSCEITGSQLSVGLSSNTFNIHFTNPANEYNYNIIKSYGTLKVTKPIKTYKVIYTDGTNDDVFDDEVYSGIIEGSETPQFRGTLYREGYTFLGWAPTINPIVSSNDVSNSDDEIIYMATWSRKE